MTVFVVILFMSATSTMYKSKSLPERFMVNLPVRGDDSLTDPKIRPKPTQRYNARTAVFLRQK